MLLVHGSRLTNFVGILSKGLKIAPPDVPASGYLFGKGLLFQYLFFAYLLSPLLFSLLLFVLFPFTSSNNCLTYYRIVLRGYVCEERPLLQVISTPSPLFFNILSSPLSSSLHLLSSPRPPLTLTSNIPSGPQKIIVQRSCYLLR